MHREHQRIGGTRLEVFLQAAREARGDLRLILVAVRGEREHLTVRRIRPAGGHERVVTGRRVVEQVCVDAAGVAVLVVVRQVDFEAGHGVELLLEPDAALPGVRVLERVEDHAWRLRRQRRGAVEERGSGHAVGRVGDEIGAPVVRERRGDEVAVHAGAEGHVRHGARIVQPAAAANDEVVLATDVVGEAGARREVAPIADADLVAVIVGARQIRVHRRRHARIDQDAVDLHIRRGGGVRIGVPSNAVVERQLIGHTEVVAEPQRVGRPRRVDDVVPAGVRVVLIESLRDRAQAREVPLRGIERGAGGNQGAEIRRHARHRVAAVRLDVPVAGVLHVDVLHADLDVVPVLVPVQVVAALEVVLARMLRVVVWRADRQTGEVVFGRADHRRLRCVGPVEVVVADAHLVHFVAAGRNMRPGAEQVRRRLGLHRRVRRVAVDAEHERVAPVPPRSADAQSAVARQLIVDAAEETLLAVLVRHGEGLAGQRRRAAEERPGFTLVLVRREVMQLVLDDRSAERSADLLVRVRQHTVRDRIRRVQ